MADFDPDAFLNGPSEPKAFDPDAFLKMAPAAPVAAPKFQQRQHAYRESLWAGPIEVPAGQVAPGPDLSAERHTPRQIAEKWGQVGKGVAKGVPASIAGGMAGDVEGLARVPLHAAFGVSPETTIPTTEQGGYLGPKGLELMNPAANPEETAGMAIGSMIGPGAALKALKLGRGMLPARVPAESPPPLPAPRAAPLGFETIDNMTGKAPVGPQTPPVLPTAPPGSPVATAREGSGARLLPPDVPHVPGPALPATESRSAGAAGISPIENVSPETIALLRKNFADEGVTPWTVEQRLEEMSPHQALGEFSPLTETHMGAVAASPGQAKLEVVNFLGQRSKEAKDRIRATFDHYFNETENLAQLKRSREIDQQKAANPLYKAFKELTIAPTDAMKELIPRLDAAGAFSEARALAGVKGVPWEQNYFTPGVQKTYPTAESWDLVKQALDSKIEQSFKDGRPTKWTRAYTELKSELVNAIDNHPDQRVAGVWKEARQAFAGPAQISEAEKLGRKFFTIDHDELPFMTAGYSDGQMAAFRSGVRKELENLLGKPGKTELRTMNQILSENNQQKLRWIIGDQETENLVRSIEHEHAMHGAPTRIHGGSQTALRQEAQKVWTPQDALGDFSAGDVLNTAGSAVMHPIGTAMKVASKVGLSKHTANQEAKFARMRDEAARLYTLQGPERDAVIRYLTAPAPTLHAKGGRVIKRAAGGRIAHANINHSPTEAQKEAGNYAKDHVKIHGLDITIENARGKKRSGVGRDGKRWSVRMPAHYGYLKNSNGADGDHVDCYIGPNIKSPRVYIIDQANADNGRFDEHKCMIGFGAKKQAIETYKRGFSDGRGHERIGHVTEMSIDQFKQWLSDGDTTKPLKRAAGGRAEGGEVSYDTALTPEEELQFQTWKQQNAPRDSGFDYDLRGAYKAGVVPAGPEAGVNEGHWPDTYKKPNHPTFSTQSKYAKDRPDLAGSWNGNQYIPTSRADGGLTGWVDNGNASSFEVAASRVRKSVIRKPAHAS